MKFIIAVIRPFKLEEVKNALAEIGVKGITATEVKGFGRQKGHTETYRGSEIRVDFVTKIKLEIAVDGNMVKPVMDVIAREAKTGKIGDGKIFVINLEDIVRIRTAEHGTIAI